MTDSFFEPPDCMGCQDPSAKLDKRGSTYTCESCGLSFSEAVYKDWKSVWYAHHKEIIAEVLKSTYPGSIMMVPDGMGVRSFASMAAKVKSMMRM